MSCPVAQSIVVLDQNPLTERLLTPECLKFLATIQRAHNATRKFLLGERVTRAILLDKGMPLVTFFNENKCFYHLPFSGL